MINGNIEAINSPIRKIEAKVELLDSSTLIDNKKLSNIKVEKTSQEGKFFGFGVSQMAKVEILDANRELTASSFKISFDGVTSLPIFYTSETERNENTNILTITGYDLLSKATKHTFAEISLEAPFNLEDVAVACANFLGASGVIQEVEEFYIDYSMEEANLEGTETLREVLDDIAEVTGTFYFMNAANELVFKRLEAAAASVDYEITKARYFTLDSGERKELQNIVSTTELGDNISGSILTSTSGVSVEVSDAVPGQEVKIQLGAADLVNPFNRDYTHTNAYGVSKTIKAGSKHIWVSGTATAGVGRNDLRNYADKFILEAGKTYVLEIKILNSENHDRVDGYVVKNNSAYSIVSYCSCLQGSKEFTIDETSECFIGLNSVTGATYDNLEVSIAVREKRTDFTGVVVSVSGDDYPAAPDGKVNGVISATSMAFTTNDETVEMFIEYPIENVVDSGVEYLRDNAFLDLREDRASIVNDLFSATKGLAINEFECTWRGNYLLELGDKLAIETKDGNYITTYFLDDTLTYNGALKQVSKWKYGSKEESASNPSTLGDKLKQTFAKVDKVNKEVEIVAGETATLKLNAQNINASVTDLNKDIGELSNRVNATITSEELEIVVQQELVNGVEKVTTATGFTFNDEGLRVSKTGSEMATQITEDGMTVSRDENAVLTADNTGVKAENLHATTYLIVGVNSRFENYDSGSRTGCFWIGG